MKTVRSPTAAKKMPAPEPNPDRQVSLHVSRAAAATDTQIISGSGGFIPARTLSGKSLGSLEHYCMDWNSADISEVSSANPQQRQHPAGPGMLAQKILAVKLAAAEADKTATVHTFFTLYLFAKHRKTYMIPSPRDSGRVLLGSDL